MLAFIITNWKECLIGALLLAIASLAALYAWERSSTVAAKAEVKELQTLSAAQQSQIAEQKKNIEDIKAHQARVQVITKNTDVIREVIKEVPAVSFAGNCKEESKDAENIKRVAGIIADYFNSRVLPKDFSAGGLGKVLPPSGKADAIGTQKPK